jgi:Actinobacteria/chloroflexi VLRF1 release factor
LRSTVTSQRLVARRALAASLGQLTGAGRSVYRDDTARFEQPQRVLSIRPAFGLDHHAVYDRIETQPLLEALARDYLVGVILIRQGGYAAAVYDGERLVASKTGSRLVHGRHRAGGSSASRFSRRRGEQARRLRAAAAQTAMRILAPYAARLDGVVLGGDRTQLRLALREHAALHPYFDRAQARLLAVPDPRQRVLDRLGAALYAAVVTDTAPAGTAGASGPADAEAADEAP